MFPTDRDAFAQDRCRQDLILKGIGPTVHALDCRAVGSASDPNPRVAGRHGPADDDRCPLSWDDGSYEATIILVEAGPRQDH